MLFNNHYHFFQSSIAGPFTQTIHGTFYLTGTGNNSGNGIGRGQTEIVMAMTGYNGFIYVRYMIYEPCDLFSVLMREAVARRIRNIHNRGAGLNNRFDYTCQVGIFSTSGIFSIKLYISYQVPR